MMQPVAQMNRPEQAAYSLARQSFARGEDDVALRAVRTLLRTRENYADVHYMLGVLSDRQGDLATAESALQDAVRINPLYAEALLALATLCERRGQYDLARQYAQRAASASARGPRQAGLDPTTRGKLANLQASLGDALAEGTVPLYWGDPTAHAVFDPDGFIPFSDVDELEGFIFRRLSASVSLSVSSSTSASSLFVVGA